MERMRKPYGGANSTGGQTAGGTRERSISWRPQRSCRRDLVARQSSVSPETAPAGGFPIKPALLLAVFLLPAALAGAILPEAIGPYHRTGTSRLALADRGLWNEYGLKESETAAYQNGDSKFSLTAYRLADSTGALGVYDWQRPAQATASKAAPLAAETADSLVTQDGNYVLVFQGRKPTPEELAALAGSLKNVDVTPLPILPGYLPADSLTPNSERYLIGPVGLAQFDPGIPPSVAAFHMGAEAQVGVFHSAKGDLTLAVFNYPTPQIAMQRVEEFNKLPGTVAKRSGPLVAVIRNPPDADFAERLLDGIRYQAIVTRDEYVPSRRDNMGDLLLNICILIGLLAAFALVSGLAVGGLKALFRRGGKGGDADAMITLHLENR